MSAQQLELFADNLPDKPYCTNHLGYGLQIRQAKLAIERRYIQHNKPTSLKWLAFDCDYPNALEDAQFNNLPQPNIAVINRENGHSHLLYSLETPVYKCQAASPKPLKYLAVVEHTLREQLKADIGYAGLVVKNPLNQHWLTVLERPDTYTLGELCEWLPPLPAKLPPRALQAGLGRNCLLFENLRRWAYKAVLTFRISGGIEAFRAATEATAQQLNIQFSSPLPYPEIKATAKSVANWTWRHYSKRWSDEQFSQIQSRRGKLGGRPSLGNPWEGMGISRATYFRQRASGLIV